ncbi:MAG TPA: hypothetical protein VK508_16340 [Cyclobacteriaceae bacterium]|nr:hypothetical protein [Cyclobacteriaceae bacterium]
MRIKWLLLFSLLLTISVAPVFAQYEGGDNDGSGMAAASCVTTLDGVDQFSFGTLTGSPTFCDFSSEPYTVNLNNPPQDIQFYWTVPAGATIVGGGFTSSISVAFGNTPGTVSVLVVTACTSQTFNMPVTNGICTMYQGGDNDGFTQTPSCTTTLDGTPMINIAPAIVGSIGFCTAATEGYSIQVDNPPSNIYYDWSVPAGSVISGQGTSVIIVTFGASAGNVSVNVITDCGTVSRTLAVSPLTCTLYAGSDGDGFDHEPACATDLNGGPVFSVVGIIGSATFCEFGNESFTASTVNAPANTYYDWTVPADATILSGQGTATILVTFGNTNGIVGVTIITDCAVVTPAPFPVTVTSCSFYAGGDNDGFSTFQQCATLLDGSPALIVGPVLGSTAFCDFATETYSINPQGVNIETTIVWSVPAGATIISGQGTTTILVQFANNSGNVSVDVRNLCTTVSGTLPVVSTPCIFYAGGDNDGHSVVQQCASNLNGGSVFIPGPIVGVATSCNFSTEAYSITVAGSLPTTVYLWSVPVGASIVSGQGTTTILVALGNTNGNISVNVSNECETINVALPVTVANCVFYAGGNNDGFSMIQQCASNLNGGSIFVPGPVVGTASSCNFSTESYSITVAGSLPTTVYLWSVPAGASIVSGQGTTTALVAFGNTSGNVSIAISNECATINVSLAVTVANCIFYAGGNNDGFSQTRTCATNLNGGSSFVPGPITGSTAFCNFGTESYSIVVAGANATTTYAWSVPAGASIVSGQGTTTILVSFASTGGNVAVLITNECETVNASLAVSSSSCVFYAGGTGDGFSVTRITNSPLPISLVSFDASVNNGIVYLKWQTSSELENDFFLIERSKDGKTFEALTKIDGAGTSNQRLNYQARDINPYHGTSYYRLSQTDFDGSINYYRVIVVKIEDFAEITKLYPNPVERDALLHLDFFAEEDGSVKISIVDPAGLSTESQLVEVKAGVNLFEFAPHFKSAGVHVIIIRSREKAQALRLVVL